MKLKEALAEIRKEEAKKFEQGIDLIVNLKGVDPKRDNVNVILTVPHKIREKKVCAFLKEKSELVDVIKEPDFAKYKEKKMLKNLIKKYDFFIATAPLMPKVATVFGKILGPAGKMPSPQLGVLMQENDVTIKATLQKIENSIKVRMKEPSIKVSAAREKMKDEEIIANIESIYKGIENALPKKRDNVKNIMIKLTMGKPVKVEF
jgi:large subunit ribosomal protein L1